MPPNKVSAATAERTNGKLSIPDWIQEDYFHEIVEKDFPNFDRIVKFNPIAATGPGENYTSTMLRIHMDIQLKDGTTVQTSYILKTMLEGTESVQVLSNMRLFPKEKEIYEKILPQFEKLYAEAGKTVHFGPKCKFVEETPEKITIVMEDLKQKNFQNVDRRFGFDLTHLEQVLKKLAEFHAASAVYHERFGPYSDHFNQSFFSENNRAFFEKMGEAKRKLYLEVLEKWGDCEKYVDLWPCPKKFLSWFIEHQIPKPNEIAVLNHGDCWSNNIMFQYNDKGDINQTYFVDYQICKWGSPTQDLYYLITTSAGYDIRVKEFDRFIRIYQENLAENLKLLQYSKAIPSLKDMHILMIEYSLMSYFTATGPMTVILIDPVEDANMDNFLNDDEFRKRNIMNPRYVKAMKQLLPWWENRGVFQFD